MANKNNLSKNELKELMRRYYAGEKLSVLIGEFGLDVRANQVHTLFPAIKRHDLVCPYCQAHLVQRALSKSAQNYSRSDNTAYCKECGHKNHEYCRCDSCDKVRSEQAEKIIRQKREMLLSTHRPKRSSLIDLSTISLTDALSLVSLARVALDEKHNKITPLKFHTLSFCVRKSTTLLALEKLHKKGLIEISLESDLRAVELSQNMEPTLDFILLSWEFRLGKGEQENLMAIALLERIIRNKKQWPHSWESELPEVWKSLALEEVLSYLELKLVEHKFAPRIGEKTKKVFLSLLEYFPISKIYNLIWVSVTNAAAYQVRSGISRQQAANTVIGNCQKRAEKALNEQWQIKSYKKDFQLPESTRISLFTHVLTDLGDRFYNEIPLEGQC